MMTIFISDRAAKLLISVFSDASFVADTSPEVKALNVANYFRNVSQSIARSRSRIPEWTMCFVLGEMSNCRAYDLRHSDYVETECVLALQPHPAQLDTPKWSDIAGRLVGYDPTQFNDFESARSANALQISEGIQAFSFSSIEALESLKDVLHTVQSNSVAPLTMGFVSPDMLFLSVDELIFRSEQFPGVSPHRILQCDGLPEAIVNIVLRDAAGHTKSFAYPPFFDNTTVQPQGEDGAQTVQATIQSVLTTKPDFTLSGDQWRELDSAFGGLATFIAQVHLHNQSPEEALAGMKIN